MRLSPSAHLDTFCRDRLPRQDQWPEFRFDLPELHYAERLNCAAELLDATAARDGNDRPCLHSLTQTWTYGEVVRRTNQLAQVLAEDFGLQPGNRVLLRGPNSRWLAAAWLAVLKAGGVAVTTMALLRPREIAAIAGLTEPSLAICDRRFAGDLAAGAPALRTLHYGSAPDEPDDLAARCAAKDGVFTAVDTAADDVAMLAPTSGTTGQPKVTMHFHRDVLATADTFSKYVIKPRRDDVFTGTPPLGFTYGLGGLLLFPLRAGASTLLIERATPGELADAIAARGVTVLSTAPTAYRAMLAAGKSSSLKELRRCVSAGEHLPKSVWEEFRQATGLAIIDGIGSTEMLHVFIAAADGDIRPGATGKAVPGYRATILDENGNPVPDGRPGRLAVQGPTGCRYLSDERQRSYVQHGWNITGDTYVRDGDGYYWFQARSDDMIISAGYNIAGPEVEEALLGHPDVLEVAVVGAPDPGRGMIVQAFVVLREGAAPDAAKAAELQDFAKESIAPYKYPRVVEFVAGLPKTISGKTQRYRLRQLAGEKLQARSGLKDPLTERALVRAAGQVPRRPWASAPGTRDGRGSAVPQPGDHGVGLLDGELSGDARHRQHAVAAGQEDHLIGQAGAQVGMPLGYRDLLAQHGLLRGGDVRHHPLVERTLHPAANRPADEPRGRVQDRIGDTLLE
jgi:2-aminobenzoate-CoA ligase